MPSRSVWFLAGLTAALSTASGGEAPTPGGSSVLAERYFAQIGAGHLGSVRFDTDFVFINSGDPTDFVLDFFESSGEPLPVLIFRNAENIDFASTLRTRLKRGETLNLSIRLEGLLKAGYARQTSSPSVNGVIAFTRNELAGSGARIQYQAGVPSAPVLRDFTIPVKFVPGVGDMAFAIVNPPSPAGEQGAEGDARIVFRIYDEAFEFHGSAERTLPAGAHLAQFIAELFPQIEELAGAVGFNGSMTVRSDRPLAAISVLHTNVPTLTTVPVTPGRADEEGTR